MNTVEPDKLNLIRVFSMRLYFFSGGRTVKVTGINLRLAKTPMLVVYSQQSNFTEVSDEYKLSCCRLIYIFLFCFCLFV